MQFEINNRQWKIKEVSQKEFWDDDNKVQTEDDGQFFGRCLFTKHEIWLDKDIPLNQKKLTLYHELFHCYKGSYITFNDMNSVCEDVWCDISANSHDIIHKIVEDYFEGEYNGLIQ